MPPLQAHSSLRPLGLLRRLARPSAVARGVWLAVALLHAWLVARRALSGEWTGALDILRGVLCLGGVAYGSLKFWQVATIFDRAPRRALTFALMLLLGHWLLAAPTPRHAGASPFEAVAVLVAAPLLGAALALTARGAARARRPRRRVAAVPAVAAIVYPVAVSRHDFFLFRRPPPVLA